MAKLEYRPIDSWDKFNFIGKRLFDFLNDKVNISTGKYVGNGAASREIKIDIIPRVIIIISGNDTVIPVIWMDQFFIFISKQLDGTNLTNGIVGLSARKDAFIIGNNFAVNDSGINFYYIILGS